MAAVGTLSGSLSIISHETLNWVMVGDKRRWVEVATWMIADDIDVWFATFSGRPFSSIRKP